MQRSNSRENSKNWASQVALVVKNPPANAGDAGRCRKMQESIPGLGRSLGVGNGNPLQYSCLENPMYRGAWQATVYGVTKNWTRLKTNTHTHTLELWSWNGSQNLFRVRLKPHRTDEWSLEISNDLSKVTQLVSIRPCFEFKFPNYKFPFD